MSRGRWKDGDSLAHVVHSRSLAAKPWRVKPMRRNFYWRVGARVESNGGVLGRDLTIDARSMKWSKNLDDQADVAARGEAWRHV